MRERTSIAAACLVALLTATWSANSAFAETSSEDPTQQEEPFSPFIVNGLFTSAYPSTALLLLGSSAGSADMLCTGTLIGCETVLTAAHCVDGSTTANDVHVFFQHAGTFGVSNITIHPNYSFPVADLAVLQLSSPVTGIAPTSINEGAHPAFGTAATIVGFGRTGGTNQEYGLKRMGEVVTNSCAGHPNSSVVNNEHVCWTYTTPIGNPGEDSSTCHGDSGGPLFTNGSGYEKVVGNENVLSGVTSGGSNNTCLQTIRPYDVDVFQYRQWIAQQGGTDLDRSFCGDMAQVGEVLKSWYTPFTGSLSAGKTQARFTVSSLSTDIVLRVALNGDDSTDFDLYVKYGSAPSLSSYDCRQFGTNSFGVCEFDEPQHGTWHILVNRHDGDGNFQVTATGLADSNHMPVADPTYAGYRVDWCKTWGTDCGKPAAEAFCDVKYGSSWFASAWKQAANIGASTPTRTLGDGSVCNQAYCDGFERITCTSPCGSGYATALVIVPAVVLRKRLLQKK
jgi:hypothetical protein